MAGSEPQEDRQLSAYRCLLGNARAMLEAAKEGRWDDLPALDAERQNCLRLAMQAELVSTRPADIETCAEMIQGILECDEQTRGLVRARKSDLAEVLGSMDNERKLADAYGTG